MSSNAVYDAIKDHLTATWGGSYAVNDFEQIETLLQQETNPWLALEDASGTQELRSIGTPSANKVADSGFVIIHGFVPSTQRLKAARTLLDPVRDDLNYRYFSNTPDVRLRVTSVSIPTPGVIHDGLWHSMLLTVDYEHMYDAATA